MKIGACGSEEVQSWQAVTEPGEHPEPLQGQLGALRSLGVRAGTRCPLEDAGCPSVTMQEYQKHFPAKHNLFTAFSPQN